MPIDNNPPARTRAQELRAFLFITVVAAPVLSGILMAGYGFSIWIYQLLTGTLPTG